MMFWCSTSDEEAYVQHFRLTSSAEGAACIPQTGRPTVLRAEPTGPDALGAPLDGALAGTRMARRRWRDASSERQRRRRRNAYDEGMTAVRVLAGLCLITAACGGSTVPSSPTASDSPGSDACRYIPAAAVPVFDAAGGKASASINTAAGCRWTIEN